MKRVSKSSAPHVLTDYKATHPTADWDRYRNSSRRYKAVKEALFSDQKGLCAYCEIDMKRRGAPGTLDDMRVEHFHPKSDTSGAHNWALDWNNLVAVCHGGSERNVVDGGVRFSAPDLSCDAVKGDENWDGVILNPLQLPASPPLFKFLRSGRDALMKVEHSNCVRAGVDVQKAQNTIDRLKLDGPRLRRLRGAVLDRLNFRMRSEIEKGLSFSDAKKKLARIYLSPNRAGELQPFFSAVRSYLGSEAEEYLTVSGYS